MYVMRNAYLTGWNILTWEFKEDEMTAACVDLMPCAERGGGGA